MPLYFKWLGVIVTLCVASLVAAEETNSLAALKEKYDIGRARVERSIFVSYTNGITSLMQQYKSAGDLDNYLLLKKEVTALATLPIIPSGEARAELSGKMVAYKDLMAKLDGERGDRLSNIQKQYLGRLDLLMRELVSGDKIDEAKLVKDEKDAVIASMRKAQPIKEPAGEKVPDQSKDEVAAPAEATEPAANAPAPVRATSAKPARELTILKATFVGSYNTVDVTAAIQDKVVDGKLDLGDYSFLRENYSVGYPRSLLIQYRYKGGLIKNVRRKYGETLVITE